MCVCVVLLPLSLRLCHERKGREMDRKKRGHSAPSSFSSLCRTLRLLTLSLVYICMNIRYRPIANQADLLNQTDQEDSEVKKKKKEKTEKINADSVQDKYIHIRTQQRNGRKSLTTLQGINPKINKKIILKECKKKFNCNGTIVEDSELGDIIQLQGDQRKNVAQFLIDEKISKKEFIKVHGS